MPSEGFVPQRIKEGKKEVSEAALAVSEALEKAKTAETLERDANTKWKEDGGDYSRYDTVKMGSLIDNVTRAKVGVRKAEENLAVAYTDDTVAGDMEKHHGEFYKQMVDALKEVGLSEQDLVRINLTLQKIYGTEDQYWLTGTIDPKKDEEGKPIGIRHSIRIKIEVQSIIDKNSGEKTERGEVVRKFINNDETSPVEEAVADGEPIEGDIARAIVERYFKIAKISYNAEQKDKKYQPRLDAEVRETQIVKDLL